MKSIWVPKVLLLAHVFCATSTHRLSMFESPMLFFFRLGLEITYHFLMEVSECLSYGNLENLLKTK